MHDFALFLDSDEMKCLKSNLRKNFSFTFILWLLRIEFNCSFAFSRINYLSIQKKNYAINHWTEKFSMSKISLSKHIVHCPRGPTFLPSFCFFFSECRSGDKNLVKQKKVLKTSKKKKKCAQFFASQKIIILNFFSVCEMKT